MKPFALLIAAACLLFGPRTLRAHEYSDATMRFTVPDDFTYQTFTDPKSGFSGFTAEKQGLKVALFRVSTSRLIDRTSCLNQSDAVWFTALKNSRVVDISTPLWKRWDKLTDYRNGEAYTRVYRYVDRKGIGFLVASAQQPVWDEADRIAGSQRYRITVGHLLDRGWYLLWQLAGYVVLGAVILAVLYCIPDRVRNIWYWLFLLAAGTVGGLLIGYEPLLPRKIWMIATAVVIGIGTIFIGDDADSEQPLEAEDGYDGTGRTYDGSL